jgi:hypothetical protein
MPERSCADIYITLRDIRNLVVHRLGAETAAADVSTVCERLCVLASMPKGQELSCALPMDWWADVAELTPILEQFWDIVEGLRLFRLLRPRMACWREFVDGV